MDDAGSEGRLKDYLALCKLRIAFLVMATAALGYALAGGPLDAGSLPTLVGVGLASCACGCLNQLLERRQDALMRRTAKRPLPAGRLQPADALGFGLALGLAGLGVLWSVGRLPFALTAATIAAYVLLYTPLKRLTPHTTWIGAAAGATAPLIGWAAAAQALPARAWILFAIQFLWQIPHFLAMFWIHREDYARAGFRVMPVVDPDGGVTAAQIALHSFTVLPISLMPSFMGMAGLGYGIGALALSTAYLGLGLRASWTLELVDTRRLFLASLAYLPILFGLLLLGA